MHILPNKCIFWNLNNIISFLSLNLLLFLIAKAFIIYVPLQQNLIYY